MAQGAARFDRKSWALSGTNTWFYNRRIWVLSRALAKAIPSRGRVLDVGCGDGQLAMALMRLRPDLKVEGVDVVARPKTLLPVVQYDGHSLPFEDKSFDYVTIVDVLHHTDDPTVVLSEAARVARNGVVSYMLILLICPVGRTTGDGTRGRKKPGCPNSSARSALGIQWYAV